MLAFPYWHRQSPIYISYLDDWLESHVKRPGWIKVSVWFYDILRTGRQTQFPFWSSAGLKPLVSSHQSHPLSHGSHPVMRSAMMACTGGYTVIALSSISHFPLLVCYVWSNQKKLGDTQGEHRLFLSKSLVISVSNPEENVRLPVIRQYFDSISGCVFLLTHIHLVA